jgi:hypothetical protein
MKAPSIVAPVRKFCYLCPEQHETYVANEQGAVKPQLTALICRHATAKGKTCNRFAIYVDRQS